MYYIKLDENMVLAATRMEPFYRGENIARKISFLIPKELNGRDSQREHVYLCYIRPDEHADIVRLISDEDYDDRYYTFTAPVDYSLTFVAGKVTMWLQICDEQDDVPIIAKTNKVYVTIFDAKNIDSWLTDDQVAAISQMQTQVDEIVDELTRKADNITYDADEHTLQLLAYGVPIGDKVVIAAGGGTGILEFQIIGKDLFVYYDDGRVENLGKVVGDDGKVYVPHIDDKKILTFTIEDMAGEIPEPTDLNPFDEWEPIEGEGETEYIWEPM